MKRFHLEYKDNKTNDWVKVGIRKIPVEYPSIKEAVIFASRLKEDAGPWFPKDDKDWRVVSQCGIYCTTIADIWL